MKKKKGNARDFLISKKGRYVLRDEGRDDLEVSGEAELEGEVPLDQRDQGPEAPVGIFLGEGHVEGSLVLDELLGDALDDAAGLGAGLGELVEGELAFKFDGVAGRRGLVPGHGGTLKRRLGGGPREVKKAKRVRGQNLRGKNIFAPGEARKILTHARCLRDPMP